jgi:hypothetical protein
VIWKSSTAKFNVGGVDVVVEVQFTPPIRSMECPASFHIEASSRQAFETKISYATQLTAEDVARDGHRGGAE